MKLQEDSPTCVFSITFFNIYNIVVHRHRERRTNMDSQLIPNGQMNNSCESQTSS